jgi:hypothetical protein
MENVKKAFETLPHVMEVWVTEDGHFHLHDHYGGVKFTRKEILEAEKQPAKKPNK